MTYKFYITCNLPPNTNALDIKNRYLVFNSEASSSHSLKFEIYQTCVIKSLSTVVEMKINNFYLSYNYSDPTYKKDILYIIFNILTSCVTQDLFNTIVQYLIDNFVKTNLNLCKTLENYFPGAFLPNYINTVSKQSTLDLMLEIIPKEYIIDNSVNFKPLQEMILQVLKDSDLDKEQNEELYNQVMRSCKSDLERIQSRLKANIKTAEKNVQEIMHAHVLKAVVSSR